MNLHTQQGKEGYPERIFRQNIWKAFQLNSNHITTQLSLYLSKTCAVTILKSCNENREEGKILKTMPTPIRAYLPKAQLMTIVSHQGDQNTERPRFRK